MSVVVLRAFLDQAFQGGNTRRQQFTIAQALLTRLDLGLEKCLRDGGLRRVLPGNLMPAKPPPAIPITEAEDEAQVQVLDQAQQR